MTGARLGTLLAIALTALPSPARAQGVRGQLTTTARYIQMRPIQRDSIPFGDATLGADGAYEFEGRRVQCVADARCYFYRALPVEDAVTFTQDGTATAWGLGMRGLSATVSLRARTQATGDFTWPRSDDHFDAMLAYVELNRGSYRVRLGRQRTAGELGFAGYDGLQAAVRPVRWLRAEAYAGRSLARGLYEPASEVFQPMDDFVIDKSAYLFGGYVELEPRPGQVVSFRYQRDIWSDRSGLLSERGGVSLRLSRVGPLRVTGSLDYDFAFGTPGKGNLTVGLPLAGPGLLLEVSARRYRPYFELWTIWGYFDPVAYHEVDGRVSWHAGSSLDVWLGGGYRWYEDTNTQPYLVPLEESTTRGHAGLSWRPGDGWTVDGSYRLELGYGASLSTFDGRLRWRPTDRLGLGVHGTAFQQIEEFRLGEANGVGGGFLFDWELARRLFLDGGVSVYRNLQENRGGLPDWSQVRGWTAVRIDVGTEPRPPGPRLRR